MCGLAGYLLLNEKEYSNELIWNMAAMQKHRGPDDSGILGISSKAKIFQELSGQNVSNFNIEPNLVFGFNRLSIVDLSSSGHQPMISKDGRVVLMMNGEIYNAFDYTKELESLGYEFRGQSDTEVVLNLYHAFGMEEMLNRINGMFSLAIYDFNISKLFLIRDRVGIKPLYILKQNNRISFSSEIKSFKVLPNFNFQLDESRISEFLLFRNCINHTLFKDIENITPGHYAEISMNGDYLLKSYYSLDVTNTTTTKSSRLEQKKIILETLSNSVKRQMISDVKLGCQLSGGIDSSLVTEFASEIMEPGTLETVSIIFNDAKYSEISFIEKVTKKLNLISHHFILDDNEYLNMIDEATWHFEQPLNHPNTIGVKLLSREAKKYVTVLLSGEGADEGFLGYSRFLPKNIKDNLKLFLKGLNNNKNDIIAYIKYWINPSDRYIMETAFNSISIATKIYPNFSFSQAMSQRRHIWDRISKSKLRKKQIYELRTYLPDLLMRQDKMSMAHSIENRVPFLDNKMLETALSTDCNFLIEKTEKKYHTKNLLKEICSDIFDEEFAYRRKMGFSIPLKSLFCSNAFQKKWNEDLLPSIEKRGIFETKNLKKWVDKPLKLNSEQLNAIWLMMGFEVWAKQYLD